MVNFLWLPAKNNFVQPCSRPPSCPPPPSLLPYCWGATGWATGPQINMFRIGWPNWNKISSNHLMMDIQYHSLGCGLILVLISLTLAKKGGLFNFGKIFFGPKFQFEIDSGAQNCSLFFLSSFQVWCLAKYLLFFQMQLEFLIMKVLSNNSAFIHTFCFNKRNDL